MKRGEQIKAKAQEFLPDILNDEYPYRAEFANGFIAGANWADRHHAYDYESVDEKIVEREVSFLDEWLDTHNNMPTFADALEWERKKMIDKACEWLNKGGYFVNNKETIEDFRKDMEEEL